MKKSFLYILGVAAIACFLLTTQQSKAQIYGQFSSIERYNYPGLFNIPANEKTEILKEDFILPPNNQQDIELNDGYYHLPLGFTYRYNNKDYTSVWISINGFVTFEAPPTLVEVARDPNGLFRIDNSTPNNVVAPYWGDHKYRTAAEKNNGYAVTSINYKDGTYEVADPDNLGNMLTRKYMLIEWKDLNVCYLDKNTLDTLKGNVYSFQVIIYQGPNDDDAKQGDIEFRYGEFGPLQSQLQIDPTVKLGHAAAAIGFKGSGFGLGNVADFFNAIYNGGEEPASREDQIKSTKLSTLKPTSSDPKLSIVARVYYSTTDEKTWGDGDADMSKAIGGRHYQFREQQNRYVTINDVRTIMKSVVTGVKLDSSYANAAYHADVHHDGRYYYLVKTNDEKIGSLEVVFRGRLSDTPLKDDDGNDVLDENGQIVFAFQKDTFDIKAPQSIIDADASYGFSSHFGQNDNNIVLEFTDTKQIFTATLIPQSNEFYDDAVITVARVKDSDMDFDFIDKTLKDTVPNVILKLKKRINWRSQNIADDLPIMISDYKKQIHWEANEKDASIILSYLGAKVPQLPWIHEDVIYNGGNKIRVNASEFADNANNIRFDNIIKTSVDTYKVPVYLNGNINGTFSSKFTLDNANIIGFESNNADVFVDFSNETKNVVVVAEGNFSKETPVAYLTISTDENVLTANSVRFDGNDANNISAKLTTGVVVANEFDVLSQNYPNPVTNSTVFTVNVANSGNYELVITDILGNLVKTLVNADLAAGTTSYTWDCTNDRGEKVQNGTYIYRLIGENTSIMKRLVIAR